MAMIVTILKVIGIIIAVVAGVILSLIALVLFHCVSYRIRGKLDEKQYVKAEVYWLFHLLHFQLVYETGQITTCFKICGIAKKAKEEASSLKDEEAGQQTEEETKAQEEIPSDASIEKNPEEPQNSDKEKNVGSAEKEPVGEETKASAEEKTSEEKSSSFCEEKTMEEESKASAGEKKKKSKSFRRDKRHGADFYRKAKGAWETVTAESNKKAAAYIGKELMYLLKHMRFRKLKTSLDFSIGDPAATGQVLGLLATLPVLYQYEVHLYPDFEAEQGYIQGEFLIKGHLRLIHVLCSFVRLAVKKECRDLFQKIK